MAIQLGCLLGRPRGFRLARRSTAFRPALMAALQVPELPVQVQELALAQARELEPELEPVLELGRAQGPEPGRAPEQAQEPGLEQAQELEPVFSVLLQAQERAQELETEPGSEQAPEHLGPVLPLVLLVPVES